ncbi:MAG: DUF4362 domain-containing protein [Bacillota bacterium]|nr:DUF4362 domain-containing protein [Bacillota bacterium]
MNKRIKLVLVSLMIILAAFSFLGCKKDEPKVYTDSKAIESSKLLKDYETSKLPKDYTREMAEKKGDVVFGGFSDTINKDKFINFLNNLKSKKKDKVRITGITTEGGAIITDLISDGKTITLVQDTTRDGFGIKGIRQYTASEIDCDETLYYAVVSGERFDLGIRK